VKGLRPFSLHLAKPRYRVRDVWTDRWKGRVFD
jgi:hypothetical protein